MADVLEYPLVNGVRHGFASIELVLKLPTGGKQIFRGFKSINYTRTRDRGLIRGNHPDPIAKTRGENSYTGDTELYLEEFNVWRKALGPGYGDLFFDVNVTYGENGFTTVTDELLGCTMDSTEASNSQGTDGLTRKVNLAPLKVKFDGDDDLQTPLVGAPT
jgi:hypothetical protein